MLTEFEKNLVGDEKNITEIGEKEVIQSVRGSYDKLKEVLLAPTLAVMGRNPDFLLFRIHSPEC